MFASKVYINLLARARVYLVVISVLISCYNIQSSFGLGGPRGIVNLKKN
jgi:hypothetical protein